MTPAPDRLTALIDEVVRCAAKLALDAVDSRECTCEDPEDGTCWFHLTPEQRVNSIAAVVALDAGYDRALAALRAEAASLQTDAERYRFLRDNPLGLRAVDGNAAAPRQTRNLDYLTDMAMDDAKSAARATTSEGNHAK